MFPLDIDSTSSTEGTCTRYVATRGLPNVHTDLNKSMKKVQRILFLLAVPMFLASVGSSVYKISCKQDLLSWDTTKHGVWRSGTVVDVNTPLVFCQKDTT